MDVCKSVLDKVLYTELSETVILYIVLLILVFGLLFAVIYIKQKTEVFSTSPNVLRIQNAQNASLDSFLTPFYKQKKSFVDNITGKSDLAENEKALINLFLLRLHSPDF